MTDSESCPVFDSAASYAPLSSLMVACLFCLPAMRWEHAVSVAVYKNDNQPDIQMSISCLHEFILPTFCPFACHFLSPSLTSHAFLLPCLHSVLLFLHSFFKSSLPLLHSNRGCRFFKMLFLPLHFYFVWCYFLVSSCIGLRSSIILFNLERAFFSLLQISSHQPITFIFILHSSHLPCELFSLFFLHFNVVPSSLSR